ncbi:ATP-dependent zinc protease family protein [Planctomicrobium sp. SH664]|uniref:ATP-dependent zinc protease family protein n=1 Tax=Planctomicrobium sp. SH664 TaxID=3448125 RepID=UPI003F5B544F
MANSPPQLTIAGWREWIALPELGVSAIKTKLDTGARTSAIHAFDIEFVTRRGQKWVRFQIHPWQRRTRGTVTAEAPLSGYREVRSSSGHVDLRPCVCTDVQLFGSVFPIELTLANRDQMGFRMLLGREAIRGRFLVDAGSSYRDSSRVPVKNRS